jgi:hypothetical protein
VLRFLSLVSIAVVQRGLYMLLYMVSVGVLFRWGRASNAAAVGGAAARWQAPPHLCKLQAAAAGGWFIVGGIMFLFFSLANIAVAQRAFYMPLIVMLVGVLFRWGCASNAAAVGGAAARRQAPPHVRRLQAAAAGGCVTMGYVWLIWRVLQ